MSRRPRVCYLHYYINRNQTVPFQGLAPWKPDRSDVIVKAVKRDKRMLQRLAYRVKVTMKGSEHAD